jgi:hypothetical protein
MYAHERKALALKMWVPLLLAVLVVPRLVNSRIGEFAREGEETGELGWEQQQEQVLRQHEQEQEQEQQQRWNQEQEQEHEQQRIQLLYQERINEYQEYSASLSDSAPQRAFHVETTSGVQDFKGRQIDLAVHSEVLDTCGATPLGECTSAQFEEIVDDIVAGAVDGDELTVRRKCFEFPCSGIPDIDINFYQCYQSPSFPVREQEISGMFRWSSSRFQPRPAVAVRSEVAVDCVTKPVGGELVDPAVVDELTEALANVLDVSEDRIEIKIPSQDDVEAVFNVTVAAYRAYIKITIHPVGDDGGTRRLQSGDQTAEDQAISDRRLVLRRAVATSPAAAITIAQGRLRMHAQNNSNKIGGFGASRCTIRQIVPVRLPCSNLNATPWLDGVGADLSGNWSGAFACPRERHILRPDATCTPPCSGAVCCMCDEGGHRAGPRCQYSRERTCHGHGAPSDAGSCTCDAGHDGCKHSREDTCNGHGDPTTTGACICDDGYAGFGGANYLRDSGYGDYVWVADHCKYSRERTCSGHGEPDAGGGCTCDDGYMGIKCIYSRNATCNGHGEPSSTGDCTCDDGYDNWDLLTQTRGINARTCQRRSRETTCNGHGEPYTSGGCDCDYDQIPGVPWLDNNETTIARSPTCADHREIYGYFYTSWWIPQLVVPLILGLYATDRNDRKPQSQRMIDDNCAVCICASAISCFLWPVMCQYALVCGCCRVGERVAASTRKIRGELHIPLRPMPGVRSAANPLATLRQSRHSEMPPEVAEIWANLGEGERS